ncbi:hypothetical protein K456DRAFT_349890 [Colletotrichum gloeosporioides 23]|nr:hypothetical protein K456DRAFT_349890 [Colletotrichum gloeosporioides 23]
MDTVNPLLAEFQASYDERDRYPQNLLQRSISTYPIALSRYLERLDKAADNLCERDVEKVDVCFRDLKTNDGGGEDVSKRNIHSPNTLTQWLGVRQIGRGSSNQLLGVAEKDPKCRFIYIYGRNSRARLNITRSMLSEILTFHQVMPDILDFLLVYGLQSEPRDLSFSSFREQRCLKQSYGKSCISSLGRSGRQYQVCYNLKGVTAKSEDPENPDFSIRPAAFYHKFDVVGGNSLWIVVKGGLDVQERFKELTGNNARPEDKSFGDAIECFRSSLSAHLMFCRWSTDDWRAYIKWLEQVVDAETKMALLAPTTGGYHYTIYTAADIQRFLIWQEKISESITVLESNIEVMKSLMRFYAKLDENQDFDLRSSCTDDIDEFCTQLYSMVNDFTLQISRAKALVKLTGDRGELIKQHRLERLNHNMEKEAILVRIVTIVTLIYLPATFVSPQTFFSTDIIKY